VCSLSAQLNNIFKKPLNPEQLDKLREAIEFMNRFSEVPDMEFNVRLFPYLDAITIVRPLSFRDELLKNLE